MSSIREEHHTASGKKILLAISELNSDNILVTIENLSYPKERRSRFKYILLLGLIFIVYKSVFVSKLFVDISFASCLLMLLYQLVNLIQCETLTFISELALQTSTKYFLDLKSSTFIPTSDIHDVVINEVICDLKVLYFLFIRTKGTLYKTKPLIPLFNGLRPSGDCLEPIYKVLYKKFQ